MSLANTDLAWSIINIGKIRYSVKLRDTRHVVWARYRMDVDPAHITDIIYSLRSRSNYPVSALWTDKCLWINKDDIRLIDFKLNTAGDVSIPVGSELSLRLSGDMSRQFIITRTTTGYAVEFACRVYCTAAADRDASVLVFRQLIRQSGRELWLIVRGNPGVKRLLGY